MDTRTGDALPYLDSNGSPIGVKEWGQKARRKFEDAGLA